MSLFRSHRVSLVCGVAGLAGLLGGCASIPTSGPTQKEIIQGVTGPNNDIGIRLVDLNARVVADVTAREAAADRMVPTIASLAQAGRNDVVGPGDVLGISIYEVGVSLFSSKPMTPGTFDPGAGAEVFPAIVVDRDGNITLPYTGAIQVAGHTPGEIQTMLEHAYRGKSQNPQAVVVVKSNVSQTVYVSGDVHKPGRIELSLQDERLLDAVAIAGGTVSQAQDMVVRFTRGGRSVEERLDRIHAGAADDLVLKAGDRIELIHEPQSFTVFGAAGKVAQVPFDQTELSLAEAVARSGGPNDAIANPRAVFLFRYDPVPQAGAPAVPTIYRLDMMNPVDYFLAQRFAMRNKDVLYVSTAAINRTAKAVGIINQLFSPFVTARAIGGGF